MRIAVFHSEASREDLQTVARAISFGGHELVHAAFDSDRVSELLRWSDGAVLIAASEHGSPAEQVYREASLAGCPCAVLPTLDGVQVHRFVLHLKRSAERSTRAVAVQRRAVAW